MPRFSGEAGGSVASVSSSTASATLDLALLVRLPPSLPGALCPEGGDRRGDVLQGDLADRLEADAVLASPTASMTSRVTRMAPAVATPESLAARLTV